MTAPGSYGSPYLGVRIGVDNDKKAATASLEEKLKSMSRQKTTAEQELTKTAWGVMQASKRHRAQPHYQGSSHSAPDAATS